MFVSECCGAISNEDIGICSKCGEHCEIMDEPDYIPGYDDGEWFIENEV